MSIRSVELGRKEVDEVLLALEGDTGLKDEWTFKLRKWTNYQDKQLKILDLIKEWLVNKCRNEGWGYCKYDWLTEDQQIEEYAYNKLEYMSGFIWDTESNKVILNKYGTQPTLKPETVQELLDYLNEKLTS